MLLASIVFYFHFAGLTGFLIIASLAVFTYLAGRYIHAQLAKSTQKSRSLLVLCLAPAALALVYFRYYEFLTTSFGDLAVWLGASTTPTASWLEAAKPAIVPLGISFFTFEFCHYLVDVYHGSTPSRNPLHFGLFALFYPRLASGPIIRYQQIIPQLEKLPPATLDDVSQGLLRISIGFCKKFLLADPAAQLIASSFQSHQILAGTDVVWLSLLLYIRIYMDFGGYCDMAIGLARLWGIRLPENFRFPFLATSLSTFWRRWHITLSAWIRDYIYIPLGGNRVEPWRKGLNLLFAMALCGLWHGSAWNFVLWGALHGIALQIGHGGTAVKQMIGMKFTGPAWLQSIGSASALAMGWVLTQVFVGLSWIFFFFPADEAWGILLKLRLLL